MNKIQELREVGIADFGEFVTYYKENETAIDSLIQQENSNSNSIFMYYNGTEFQKNIIKFLSIFSPKTHILISIEQLPNGLYNHSWTIPLNFHKNIGYSDVVKTEFELENNKSFITPIFLSFSNKEMSNILLETKRLSELDLLTIRPSKAILKITGNGSEKYIPGKSKDGIKGIKIFPVSIFSSGPRWLIADQSNNYSPNVQQFITSSQRNSLTIEYKISLPFISNTDLETFSNVIYDNEEILSSLRLSISKLAREISTGKGTISHAISEEINPSIDKIERQFIRIQSSRAFKNKTTTLVYASVSIFAFSIGTLSWPTFLAFTSPALYSFFNTEDTYMKSISELKESPYFVFWKLNGLSKTK